MSGPVLPFCDYLHFNKYRDVQAKESYDEFAVRFSTALADNPEHGALLHDAVKAMRIMAAGRVQAWAGSSKVVTPYNCYVSPTINDSFVDAPKAGEDPNAVSIMDAMKYAAQTMRQGGGIGYAWSTLRPKNALIRGVMSTSDGPIAFMPIADAVCQATSSAGNRRGAQMSVLRCDHPDIMDFIKMKRNNNNFLTGMNISVGVTDELMEAVARKGTFNLRFNGEIYKTVDAEELWNTIMLSTWDWAEPGVLFLDTINRMNNLWYCERIEATNPCGEQPLPPWGACLLGSLNLTKYIKKSVLFGDYVFDWELFIQDIHVFVRALDNVIDKATYPLSQQEVEAKSKRRMGIGITGLANALEILGHPYGSIGFTTVQTKIQNILSHEAYRASIQLAKEKGSFPLFDAEKYLGGPFIKDMPDDIRDGIKRYGIRNSHLTSIAPTGTISFCADNASSGIEPAFALEMERPVKLPTGTEVVTVKDYAYNFYGVKGRTTAQVTLDEHMSVLLVAAKRVDSAVSKTINVDKHVKWDDFKGIYQKAYEGGAKGCTTFNKDGKRFGLLTDKDEDGTKAHEEAPAAEEKVQACFIDPSTGTRTCE